MKKKSKVFIISIILILIVVAGAIAAYTSRSYVKGVATTPKQGLALSSDYLVVVAQSSTSDKYAVKKILLDEKSNDDTTPYTFSFYVQNSSDGSVSKKSMQYKLYISGLPAGAEVYRGAENITGSVSEGATSPLMGAYTKVTHNYKITIPKESINTMSNIVITAIPDADSDSSGNMLAAKVQLSVAGVVAGFSYSGNFLDKTQANAPYEFAAFNYEVSVSNASEAHTMVLTWYPKYVEIDPLFLKEELGMTDQNTIHNIQTSGRLEFVMDAVRSNYLIKFYRLKGQNASEQWQTTWENLEEVIKFNEK